MQIDIPRVYDPNIAVPSIVVPNVSANNDNVSDGSVYSWPGKDELPLSASVPISESMSVSSVFSSSGVLRSQTLPIFPGEPNQQYTYEELSVEDQKFVIRDIIGFWLTVQTLKPGDLFHELEKSKIISLAGDFNLPVDLDTLFTQYGLEQLISELNRLNGKSPEDLRRRPFNGAQVVSRDEQLLLNLNSPDVDVNISVLYVATVSRNSIPIFDTEGAYSPAGFIIPTAGRFEGDLRRQEYSYYNHLVGPFKKGDKATGAMKIILVRPENWSKKEFATSDDFDSEQVLILELYDDGSYSYGKADPLRTSPKPASRSFLDPIRADRFSRQEDSLKGKQEIRRAQQTASLN